MFTTPSSRDDLTFQVTVMDGRGASDRAAATATVDDFTPQDGTFSTPGTYTLNIGRADRVYISGKAGDGGGGGGDGGAETRYRRPENGRSGLLLAHCRARAILRAATKNGPDQTESPPRLY